MWLIAIYSQRRASIVHIGLFATRFKQTCPNLLILGLPWIGLIQKIAPVRSYLHPMSPMAKEDEEDGSSLNLCTCSRIARAMRKTAPPPICLMHFLHAPAAAALVFAKSLPDLSSRLFVHLSWRIKETREEERTDGRTRE